MHVDGGDGSCIVHALMLDSVVVDDGDAAEDHHHHCAYFDGRLNEIESIFVKIETILLLFFQME